MSNSSPEAWLHTQNQTGYAIDKSVTIDYHGVFKPLNWRWSQLRNVVDNRRMAVEYKHTYNIHVLSLWVCDQ